MQCSTKGGLFPICCIHKSVSNEISHRKVYSLYNKCMRRVGGKVGVVPKFVQHDLKHADPQQKFPNPLRESAFKQSVGSFSGVAGCNFLNLFSLTWDKQISAINKFFLLKFMKMPFPQNAISTSYLFFWGVGAGIVSTTCLPQSETHANENSSGLLRIKKTLVFCFQI